MSRLSQIGNALATITIVAAAIAVAIVALHREFGSGVRVVRAGGPSAPPTYVKDWERLGRIASWSGDSTAKVKIVEFADFECPYCGRFHAAVAAVRQAMGKDVAVALVQFPLTDHRFAKPAAFAADCAARQGRWDAFQDVLFEKQDSFGLMPWTNYAVQAKVPDLDAFNKCVAATTDVPLVDSGLAAGKRLEVHGTPTVIINGWRYSLPPSDSLGEIVKAMLVRSK